MQALILGHTGGIGAALADRLTALGHEVTGRSRADGLELTDEAAVAAVAQGLGERRFAVIILATGALSIGGAAPEKALASIDPEVMAAQFALNATGPALVFKHFAPLLAPAGRMAVLSARLGSIGDNRAGGWIAYRAAKAALNQITRTAAIEIARRNPGSVVVALHPGTVDTALTRPWRGKNPAITPAASAEALLSIIGRLTPGQTGSFIDWKGMTVPW